MGRRRTGSRVLFGNEDRRVEHTRRALHQALIALVREKDYDQIAVREILDRAHVSRSTFYTHFAGKDELLVSGIEGIVMTSGRGHAPTSFSLPILEHHDQHRQTGRMSRQTRIALHGRLRALIARRIREDARRSMVGIGEAPALPPDLLAQFVASTFIVVLDWWLDTRSPLSPVEMDEVFCSLVAHAVHGARTASP